MLILLNACSNKDGKDNTASDFSNTFLSKFTPMPSDSILLYMKRQNYTDTVFYGGKLLSPEEIKLIPKENKDSITPDSGRFLATYRIDIDSLYSAIIINHPDRYRTNSFFLYLYNKKINLISNQSEMMAYERLPFAANFLVVRRNKLNIPESIAIQNKYYADSNNPDSLSNGFEVKYIFNNAIDIYKGF